MAETGGPVYEGVGRPEMVKPKLVDKVITRVKDRLQQNTGEIVEQKWIDAYQKTVDATDPGMRKKILEKVRPVAVGVAKLNRFGAAVNDVFLQVGGAFDVLGNVRTVVKPEHKIASAKNYRSNIANLFGEDFPIPKSTLDKMDKIANSTPGQIRLKGGVDIAKGGLKAYMGHEKMSRVASGWFADISGKGGEKIAQITNKILGRKHKAESAAAKPNI